ncbi:MAG: sulfite exporter TauE/SafE family protein [Planctomycetaceae bacterium]|nr:sulfite exporter TauE/SafE family protein [Planctomycetales bacterium]MCB9874211.1 sulfite exporter TauE/SafE family protein [Planctomycetaceae bacterium]MCB9940809.1 sulfite exporter TauE/SafE family protein [Planctomycetaceae bacterium]
MIDTEIVATVAILFVACLTRSSFGFGEALVAMPLLSMVIGVKDAAATVALTSIFNAVVILLSTKWKNIEWSAAGYMLAGALLGIPLGVYVLVNVPESAVKLVLAALVISFAVYNLTRPRMTKLESNVPGIGFGFVAGILGGAYNTIGPPMVIFGTLRHWPPQRFRITLQAVFFPTSLVVAGFHSANKLWTPLVVKSFIVAIPFLVLAAFVGREINRRFEGAKFSRYIFYLLLVIGAVLIGTIVRDACT